MLIKRGLLVSASLFVFSLVANFAAASAEQWYFFIKNSTSSTIKSILVSENGNSWGYFDIGVGIAPGENTKLVWSSSTNNESCSQLIKATFADGTESTPARFNFCKDLDTPIEFQ